MQVVLEKIEYLHKEMRILTIRSGINDEDYNIIMELTETSPLEILEETEEFLDEVYQYYRLAKEIWDLLSERVWKMYDDMGETSLREQVLLREKLKPIRYKWKKFIKQWKQRNNQPIKD